ncbi:MAG: cytochrome c oxidase subunit II [Candidatus Eremiobacteraeota bacterium]|nr:cytochrome c oxidase subunit II [Candidatus Eremiobacteraeota bacterium]MCW5869931.1 cytochrome c oxidase subunit II [Candidatus Eremiobacteraeota bacterium]
MKLGPFPIWPQLAASEAGGVDFVTLVVLGICSFFALAVLFCMVFFLVLYRQGSPADRAAPPLSNNRLEIGWIVLPTLLSLGLFWVGAREYYRLYQLPESTDVTVDVVGKQWMWIAHYSNGTKEINRLHLPLGKRVTLRMISQDVIHSLFIPDFRVKHDVLPGRYTYLWFQPTRVGQFRLFCAEFCGTSHAAMGGWVEVMTPEDFQRWQDGGQVDPVQRGKLLFQQHGCQGCHEGSVAAPRLQNLAKADEDDLRRSIVDPNAEVVPGFQSIMPSYAGRLNEEQILDLIAYLRSRP